MSEAIDPMAAALDIGREPIKRVFDLAVQGVAGVAKRQWYSIFEEFEDYTKRIYRQNTQVRIISSGDKDVYLYDIYIPHGFDTTGEEKSDVDILEMINNGENVIISGSGGYGKTLFVKHLWVSIFEKPFGKVPVFIELRGLNDLTKTNLSTFIRLTLSKKGNLDEGTFQYLCDKGRFCFILDGLDELNLSKREIIAKEIIDLASKYDACSYVMTSRPDSTFHGWQGFTKYNCLPFKYEETRELLSKVPFDEKKRCIFLKILNEKFYNSNKEFLSNPLLSIIMMMTFREEMDVPDKLVIFYDAAFGALYGAHDSTKFFNREKYLDKQQFKDIFSIFCILSYCSDLFEFSEDEIFSYIEKSQKILQSNYDQVKVSQDFTKNVCLMIEEGWNHKFIHRSFQEYFSALALTGKLRGKKEILIKNIKDRYTDNVLKMAYQIDQNLGSGLIVRARR